MSEAFKMAETLPRERSAAARRGARMVLVVAVNLVLVLFCLTYIFPFFWLGYNSLKNMAAFTSNIFSLPAAPVLDNYVHIFQTSEVYWALGNSLGNTAIAMVFTVGLSFVVAYFLSRYTFPGRRFLYGFFLLGMLVPIYALLIPVYIQFNRLGLIGHRFTLLIPYVTFALPQTIYLYDSYMRSVPRSIEEAAYVDGADVRQIMTSVMLPICAPITGTVLVLNFLGTWNEFPFALVLTNGPSFRTVPVWLTTFQGQYSANVTMKLTAMLIAAIPMILAYLFLRRQMMEGLTAGAIKG